MHSKIWLFLVVTSLYTTSLFAQQLKTALVKGKLHSELSSQPAPNVQILFPLLWLATTTDNEGDFSFSQIPYGTHKLVISNAGSAADTVEILVNKDVVDLGVLYVDPAVDIFTRESIEIPLLTIDDLGDEDEEGLANINVSGLLTANPDAFLKAAAFSWSPYWFKPRGYDQQQLQVLINGAPMNDLENNTVPWAHWGGLNDVFRNRHTTYGLEASEYTLGGLTGAVFLDATAAAQRRQTRATYSLSNRQYRHRLMVTHSSGLLKNGWAFSLTASRRWANEGYIEGTFYDSYSWYTAVSKKLSNKHQLNLTTFASPTRRGKARPSYQEAFDILGNNFYNPNWGYQNGRKRNARIADNFQPVFLVSHDYTPSKNTKFTTTVGYQWGRNKDSRLDWYNASDPRPDYYRYLPSYYLLKDQVDSLAAQTTRNAFRNTPQIKWDELYQSNFRNMTNIPNPDGAPGSETGRRSLYVLGNDVDAVRKWIFNTNLRHILNNHITVYTGVSFLTQQTESYRELADLLGGDFYLNVNSFAERNMAATSSLHQNDLNNPYGIIREGDKYLYHYLMSVNKGYWWGQAAFSYNRADFFVSANYGFHSFQREGLFRNGVFVNSSYGKSPKQIFAVYGLKCGLTYKINGRNYVFLNAGLAADAPTVDNTYVSPRVRNAVVQDPESRNSYAIEAGYLLRSPKTSARVSGYVTDMKDITEKQIFFYQGTGNANTMVQYVMQDMNARFIGTELALEYKLNSAFTFTGAASLGQAFYTNNPRVTIYQENTPDTIPKTEDVYMKNHYLGVGPQTMTTLGLNYRSRKYWYANLNLNFIDRNFVDIAASRRTPYTVEMIEPGSPTWKSIVEQERFPSAYTLDLFFGKSFLLSKMSRTLPDDVFLYLSVSVNNLLDNQEIRTSGFENARFDYSGNNPNLFASRYFYALGRNYFINLALKF